MTLIMLKNEQLNGQDDLQEIKELLIGINKRLDFLEKEAKFNRKQWENTQSTSYKIKRWGGYYLANLMADETLGLNGTSSIFEINSK